MSLINPEEIKKLQKKAKEKEKEKHIEQEITYSPPINTGGTVKIMFESGGRFGNPEVIYMSDLKGRHINDLATVKEDRILETLVSCLNECVVEPVGFDVSDLTDGEFFELLLGMKLAFDSSELEYRYYHSCQSNIPEEEKRYSTSFLNLKNLNMISIEESDIKIREYFSAKLNELSDSQYSEYLRRKYNKNINISIEEEVNSISIKEPFSIPDYDCIYEFNLMRVKYLIEAHRISSKEFDNKIRIASNKSIFNISKEEASAIRQDDIEKIKLTKSRRFIQIAQALCLVSKTDSKGKYFYTTVEDKLNESNNFSKLVPLNYIKATDLIIYGVHHEFTLDCDLCDNSNPERGYLRKLITPYHLLPISNFETTSSSRKSSVNNGFDFYF